MLKKAFITGVLGVYSLCALSPFAVSIAGADVTDTARKDIVVCSPLSFANITYNNLYYAVNPYNANGIVSPFVYTAPVDKSTYYTAMTLLVKRGSLGSVSYYNYIRDDYAYNYYRYFHTVGLTNVSGEALTCSNSHCVFDFQIMARDLRSFTAPFYIVPVVDYTSSNVDVFTTYELTFRSLSSLGAVDEFFYRREFSTLDEIDISMLTLGGELSAWLSARPNDLITVSGDIVCGYPVTSVERCIISWQSFSVVHIEEDTRLTLFDYQFNVDNFLKNMYESSSDGLIISAIADDVSAFFAIELFPGFTFGNIALIGFGGIILGFVLKFFLGG